MRILEAALALCLFASVAVAQQQVPIVGGAVTIPAAPGNSYFSVVLNQNVTSFRIAGTPPSVTVLFVQDSTGGRTVSGYASNISNTSAITIASAANATTAASFTYNSGANVWTASGGGGSSGAPGQGNIYVVDTTTGGSCGSLSNCYAIGEVRVTADGATTSGSPTITSATMNFTAADVGKIIYAVNASSGALDQKGTILSVTNSTTAVSTVNSTATGTALTLVVGSDAAPNLHTAYLQALSLNQGISLPCGQFLLNSNAPVFDASGSPQLATQNYGVSGCGAGGNSNSTLFVLGPGLQDTTTGPSAAYLVANIPLAALTTTFPYFNRGSSWGVSNLQISGLSYKAANTGINYIINTPRAFNVRIYDTNSAFACWDVGDIGTQTGEDIYERLNLQVNHNGLATSTCGGVMPGSEGENTISDSVIAFLSQSAVNTSAQLSLRNDYITNVGKSNNTILVNGGLLNVVGGMIRVGSNTPTNLFSQASTGRINLEGVTIYQDSSPSSFIFNTNGGSIYAHNTTFLAVTPAHVFQAASVASAHFYNEGGNTWSALPTTNIPIYMSTSSEAGTGTCAANAATITFGQTYLAAPVVTISPTTSASTGDQITATSATTATVHCNGATDGFTYTVTPNPF